MVLDPVRLLHLVVMGLLVLTAVAALLARDLLTAIIIFGVYSFSMAVTYLILRSADVAMTEAAVGAGVTTILFIATLGRVRRNECQSREKNKQE